MSSETDLICEQIYKKITDTSGNILDRYMKICELVDIDPKDVTLK